MSEWSATSKNNLMLLSLSLSICLSSALILITVQLMIIMSVIASSGIIILHTAFSDHTHITHNCKMNPILAWFQWVSHMGTGVFVSQYTQTISNIRHSRHLCCHFCRPYHSPRLHSPSPFSPVLFFITLTSSPLSNIVRQDSDWWGLGEHHMCTHTEYASSRKRQATHRTPPPSNAPSYHGDSRWGGGGLECSVSVFVYGCLDQSFPFSNNWMRRKDGGNAWLFVTVVLSVAFCASLRMK